jgi:hypothetical protein
MRSDQTPQQKFRRLQFHSRLYRDAGPGALRSDLKKRKITFNIEALSCTFIEHCTLYLFWDYSKNNVIQYALKYNSSVTVTLLNTFQIRLSNVTITDWEL